jgi:hypothetical protein
MMQLILLRDALKGEYEDAISVFESEEYTRGLLTAIKVLENRINRLIEEAGI